MDVKALYRANMLGDHDDFEIRVANWLMSQYWAVKEKDRGSVAIPAPLARMLAEHLRRPK